MMESQPLQTVLVVDDLAENIDVLAAILKPHFRVKAATSAAKALAIARSDAPPDLILLDILMPQMSGYEVCVQLKAQLETRRIPVIFVTAMSEVEDESRGFELGAVDYLTKPVSPSVVLARVRTHLALYDQQRELWQQVEQRTAELKSTRMTIIECLGRAAEYKDDQTGHHVIRMAHYARLLALDIGMPERDADLLFQAAPMHDIGKIGTPDHILKKPGKLTPEEWAVMKQHVDNGALILGNAASALLELARTVVLSHHEKWDGSGYPRGLSGEQIPLAGRIVALADVFDALSSERPYKRAWPIEQVIAYISAETGKHFDPRLVPRFLRLVPQMLAIRASYTDAEDSA